MKRCQCLQAKLLLKSVRVQDKYMYTIITRPRIFNSDKNNKHSQACPIKTNYNTILNQFTIF